MRIAAAILLLCAACQAGVTNFVACRQGVDSNAAWVNEQVPTNQWSDLKLWMPFPSASGLTNDYSTSKSACASVGAVWDSGACRVTNAQYVTVGAGGAYEYASGDFTVTAWFNNTNAAAGAAIMDCRDDNDDGWRVVTVGLGIYVSANTVDATAFASYTYGNWTHVAATFDRDSVLTIYVDGAQVGSTPDISAQTFSTSVALCAGAMSYGGARVGVGGWLDDMRIYSRALTAPEVGAIYTNTVGAHP